MQGSCHVQEASDSGTLSATAYFDEFKGDKSITLQIFGKNVQSLQTNERESELFEELECFEWDIILLNETWRSMKQEKWSSEDGHVFCGSGGTEGGRGVAILLNKRWSKSCKAVHCVSDRVCAVDVNFGGRVVRFISAYFPHAGYEDHEVEAVYLILQGLIDAARRKNWTCITFGDWNAVIGQGQGEDDPDSVGLYGIGQRNERGRWLAQWATAQQVTIANTMFEKTVDQQWTHNNGINKRQIDFFFICSRRWSWITDACANEQIGVGKDHRTVALQVKIPAGCNRKPRKRTYVQKGNSRGWTPKDESLYKEEVAAALRAKQECSTLQASCRYIEQSVLQAARKCKGSEAGDDKIDDEKKRYLRQLIKQRKSAKEEGDPAAVARTSKLIRKEIRRLDKINKTTKITKILKQFKELGQLADIRKKGKKEGMNSVVNKDGKECASKEDIAEVFAEFYESLYAKVEEYDYRLSEDVESVVAVTRDEVRKQLRAMKRNKAADEAGIVAEMLKEGGDDLMDALACLFTEVLKPGAKVPLSWCSSSIRVLFKKGDPKLPANYRPVCIIPILYKLFSRIICDRIKDVLLAEQSADQAGFRPGYSCDDHLYTITILAEKASEFNIPLWVAAIDFSKAFDSISHRSIFEALKAQNIPMAYVDMLMRLYKEQTASVRCDCQSRTFRIFRGTKQGDPISPLIFNAVLEQVLRPLKEQWTAKKYGIQLDAVTREFLTNLRFADDILVIGRSLPQIKKMLEDIMTECEKVGLSLHPEKTKIMHNGRGYGSKVTLAKIKDVEIEILNEKQSTMYLGRLLALEDSHDVEVSHRIRRAWTKFGLYKSELTEKMIPLELRLRLFNAVITPTILYGSGSWVLTAKREQSLQATQMKMLRAIFGYKRKKDEAGEVEPWASWIKRVTDLVKMKIAEMKIPLWPLEARSRRNKWIARLGDMEAERWAKRASEWQPIGFRRQGRPKKRYKED